MRFDEMDNGAADDDAVGNACDFRDLLWSADAESDGERKCGELAHAAGERSGGSGQRLLLAGDAGSGDQINKAGRMLGH